MTIVGVQLIDRVGRRRLLLIGALGMCISEFIVALVGVTAGHINPVTQVVNKSAQNVLIAFTCMYVPFPTCLFLSFLLIDASHRYIAFYATSWGPVIWVLTGEIFVSVLRAYILVYLFVVSLLVFEPKECHYP